MPNGKASPSYLASNLSHAGERTTHANYLSLERFGQHVCEETLGGKIYDWSDSLTYLELLATPLKKWPWCNNLCYKHSHCWTRSIITKRTYPLQPSLLAHKAHKFFLAPTTPASQLAILLTTRSWFFSTNSRLSCPLMHLLLRPTSSTKTNITRICMTYMSPMNLVLCVVWLWSIAGSEG